MKTNCLIIIAAVLLTVTGCSGGQQLQNPTAITDTTVETTEPSVGQGEEPTSPVPTTIPILTTPATPTPTTPAPTTATPIPTTQPSGYADSDRDGLSDSKERQIGTDLDNDDTDGDGISDYDEITKYRLNPLAADSDGDGTPDSDMEERREYTYSIQAICAIRQPYDVSSMSNHFQDVVALSEASGILTYQVTFYPAAYHIIEEIPLDEVHEWYDGLDRFLTPDPLMNFDEEMSGQTRELFAAGEGTTDMDAVRQMYAWERSNITVKPGYSGGGSYPEPFLDLSITKDNQIIFPQTPIMFSYGEGYLGNHDWQLSHLVLGKSCFDNRTYGSCGSAANFHATILRSLGIPTRIIQTVPILDPTSAEQRKILSEAFSAYNALVLMMASETSYNHFMCEAFIGNRWIRLNESDYSDKSSVPFIKAVSFASWKEADFSQSWGQEGRPYSLIQVEERQAVHQPKVYRWTE